MLIKFTMVKAQNNS